MCLSEVQVGLPLPPVGDRIHSLFPPALAVDNLGHVDIRVTHVVPHNVVPHMLSRTCPALSPALLWPCAFAQHRAGMHSPEDGAEASKKYPYCSNRPSPDLRKSCLPTFAGKLDFGCVRATSAIDVPMLASTGVAR
jgi:hypothetical protein